MTNRIFAGELIPVSPLRARLLLFSGRHDPEYAVGLDIFSRIVELYAEARRHKFVDLAVSDSQTPTWGYNGFLLTNVGAHPALPNQLRVWRGRIQTGTETLHDSGIEELLLREASERGLGNLVTWARRPR